MYKNIIEGTRLKMINAEHIHSTNYAIWSVWEQKMYQVRFGWHYCFHFYLALYILILAEGRCLPAITMLYPGHIIDLYIYIYIFALENFVEMIN